MGFPLTFRRDGFSVRAKLYHQSSHLGDEYLLRSDEIVRENLSFESIEFLVSQELSVLRIYAGAEKISGVSPAHCRIRSFTPVSSCGRDGPGRCRCWLVSM